jgi:hypothetical protein
MADRPSSSHRHLRFAVRFPGYTRLFLVTIVLYRQRTRDSPAAAVHTRPPPHARTRAGECRASAYDGGPCAASIIGSYVLVRGAWQGQTHRARRRLSVTRSCRATTPGACGGRDPAAGAGCGMPCCSEPASYIFPHCWGPCFRRGNAGPQAHTTPRLWAHAAQTYGSACRAAHCHTHTHTLPAPRLLLIPPQSTGLRRHWPEACPGLQMYDRLGCAFMPVTPLRLPGRRRSALALARPPSCLSTVCSIIRALSEQGRGRAEAPLQPASVRGEGFELRRPGWPAARAVCTPKGQRGAERRRRAGVLLGKPSRRLCSSKTARRQHKMSARRRAPRCQPVSPGAPLGSGATQACASASAGWVGGWVAWRFRGNAKGASLRAVGTRKG